MIDEHDVREMLQRRARTVPATPADTPTVVRRARRRLVLNGAVATVGAAAIVVATFAGLEAIHSAPTPANQPTPVMSGDLAYAFDGDIYVADPDGSNAVKITDGGPAADCKGVDAHWVDETPEWSPDGRYLAFRRTCLGSGAVLPWDVVITDPQGTVVAELPSDGWGAEWSPDSTRVAVMWGDVGRTIDVYGLDGERQASLPLPRRMYPHYDSGPGAWMPDGSALLLYGVFVVPLDGSAPHDLSLGGEATYSPDGTLVAVVTGNSISVLGADGSLVSEVGAPLDGVDAWSPDGEHFVSLSHGELNVVDAASGTVTVLTEARTALFPGRVILGVSGFSPQGDRILYATGAGNGGSTALYSIGIDGSDARLVVAGTPQGQWRSR